MSEFLIVAVKDSLNLRREPAVAESNVVQALPPNTVLECFESKVTPERTWRKARTDKGAEGWVAAARLRPWGDKTARITAIVPWLNIAVMELGQKEIAGSADNPRIIEYHQATASHLQDEDGKDFAWCSSFANWCMKQVNASRTNSVSSSSWRDWGQALATPRQGAITVFKRFEGGVQVGGHVAFLIEDRGASVLVLGGNQGDAVCLHEYDKNGDHKLLSYRWPAA